MLKSKVVRSLDQLDVVEPCHEPWDAMRPVDPSRRHCASCAKHVHDVAAMTRAEAERLMSSPTTDLCIRFMRDGNGRVLTREDFGPAHARRCRGSGLLRRAAMIAASFGIGAIFNLGCDRETPPLQAVSGKVVMPIEPTSQPTTLPATLGKAAPPRATAPKTVPAVSPLMGSIAPMPLLPPAHKRTAALPKQSRRS